MTEDAMLNFEQITDINF